MYLHLKFVFIVAVPQLWIWGLVEIQFFQLVTAFMLRLISTFGWVSEADEGSRGGGRKMSVTWVGYLGMLD